MPAAPAAGEQPLPESEDVAYAEPPKSIGLYVDATKWIVGLATGSFLLSGSILVGVVAGPSLALLAGLAVLAMAAAAGAGVRALLCYTRLANLIEVHAARKPFEVAMRNDGAGEVRWVTSERVARARRIGQWLAGGNLAYSCMTWAFGAGLVLYLAFAAVYLRGAARQTAGTALACRAATPSVCAGGTQQGTQ